MEDDLPDDSWLEAEENADGAAYIAVFIAAFVLFVAGSAAKAVGLI